MDNRCQSTVLYGTIICQSDSNCGYCNSDRSATTSTASAPLIGSARVALVQYEMERSAEEITRAANEIRPTATKRAYAPKMTDFESWPKETLIYKPLEQRTIS
ncbi:hypothetical protein MBANPS3_012254 [Mucor bainieri]